MSSRLTRQLVLAALLCAGLPVAADAQIYSWRDVDGSLVLSSTARTGAAVQTYSVANAPASIRTTRPLSRRAQEFEPFIVRHASANDVRPDLVRAVIQAESAFNPHARSHKGAMGLMQLMPATAAELGVTDPYDPNQNIRGGVTYLKTLLLKYSHNEELALAAYNAGPGAVAKYGTVPPYRETRDYIARIKNTAGPSKPTPRPVQRSVEVVGGREVTVFSNKPERR
ncbi:MAG: lytic transglycosylase domain-containing protein [Acidobacteria bacterium]|jgi:soluble lytic murein transglycosylase-like protein|nr:lytic transglycosylase domain-containing protein [Acidobacteriota bacterium]